MVVCTDPGVLDRGGQQDWVLSAEHSACLIPTFVSPCSPYRQGGDRGCWVCPSGEWAQGGYMGSSSLSEHFRNPFGSCILWPSPGGILPLHCPQAFPSPFPQATVEFCMLKKNTNSNILNSFREYQNNYTKTCMCLFLSPLKKLGMRSYTKEFFLSDPFLPKPSLGLSGSFLGVSHHWVLGKGTGTGRWSRCKETSPRPRRRLGVGLGARSQEENWSEVDCWESFRL